MTLESSIPQGSSSKPDIMESSQAQVREKGLTNRNGDDKANPLPINPVILEFKRLIETDSHIYMLFHQMFEKIKSDPPSQPNSNCYPQVHNYIQLLTYLNRILSQAPSFSSHEFAGLPFNALLAYPMATPSGSAAFLHPKVNGMFQKLLNEWAAFLRSPASRHVLTADAKVGWFSAEALSRSPGFANLFICDPTAPYYGFTSWDDFFTRRFRPGVRPIASPHDARSIVQACESTPFRISEKVQAHDRFWLKSQPYSLNHMLGHDPLGSLFVGGTVFQAYLAAFSYHRWHSPVSGRIVKTVLRPGAYFSAPPPPPPEPSPPFWFPDSIAAVAEMFAEKELQPCTARGSLAYNTQVATRAMIYIQADCDELGLLCFMAVGLTEVSSCEVSVREGQHVAKGQELGMFHYGGSTYCLLLRRGVHVRWSLEEPGPEAGIVEIGREICSVEG